jgi:hypothetical protein
MCKPHRCPHIAMTGNICVYCPGGPDSDFEYSTQSYTGYEVTEWFKNVIFCKVLDVIPFNNIKLTSFVHVLFNKLSVPVTIYRY